MEDRVLEPTQEELRDPFIALAWEAALQAERAEIIEGYEELLRDLGEAGA